MNIQTNTGFEKEKVRFSYLVNDTIACQEMKKKEKQYYFAKLKWNKLIKKKFAEIDELIREMKRLQKEEKQLEDIKLMCQIFDTLQKEGDTRDLLKTLDISEGQRLIEQCKKDLDKSLKSL